MAEDSKAKTELLFKFAEEDTLLAVVVKLPAEIPRVMPIEIDTDIPTFLSDFSATWIELGKKVHAEFVRGATS